ncbi:MAG: replication-relaxation family protein [Chloroflexota bacterium]|nr:replication-relaxation family protein [Chloroflexota bacterium]
MKPQVAQPATRRRLGPSGRAALHLLACCPRVPTDVVASLLRVRHARSAAQLLLRLRIAGLTDYETVRPGPLVGSGSVRLWTLTPAGHAVLRERVLAPPEEARSQLPNGEPAKCRDVARQRDVPMLVATYRLLASVVRELDRPVRIAAWEHPWIRTLRATGTGRARQVRLPAAAVLIQQDAACGALQRLLLLPDVGTLPVASYRPVLRGLIELRETSTADAKDETLLVVGVAAGGVDSNARVAAWHALLQQVARRAGEQPPRARVVVCPAGLVSSEGKDRQSGSQAEQVFGLVARHPLLTRQQLATLLCTSVARTGRLVVELRALGWVRTVQSDNVPPDALKNSSGPPRRLALVELTPAGRREFARRLLLPAAVATRHHGLLGKDGSTRPFLWHLAHTLGANAIFVALVSAARRVCQRGGDDALEEWRSAGACARGRFRPDGYGCYRRGGSRFGFFLEFDRGTEKPREYATKLAAYYRYRDSGGYQRDYASFPSVLLVTTSELAEARFAHQAYLAHHRYGSAPLLLFLTTTGRIKAHPEGVLGPIWRSAADPWAGEPARVCWLPHPRVSIRPDGTFALATGMSARAYCRSDRTWRNGEDRTALRAAATLFAL